VSLFRPAVRVTDPAGHEWELYAFRVKLSRPRRPLRPWLLAVLRSLRSDEWTIEAVGWILHETRYTWTTTSELRRNVLAQIEGQIARGEVPTPRRATFLGRTG